MARIETDPNYSSPTFSRATAAADLFKKEDVQALAAAVSTHDHTSGKGLVLPATAIPDGSITSAKIADGTIQTVDIASGAIWNLLNQYVGAPSFATTTVGTPLNTPVAVSFTNTVPTVRCDVSTMFNHSVVGGTWFIGIALDGGATAHYGLGISPLAGIAVMSSFAVFIASVTPGFHTVVMTAYNATAGTLTASTAANHALWVSETKR